MNGGPLYISEREVVELIDLPDAIEALEHGLRAEAAGAAVNLSKAHLAWSGGGLHAIGAVFTNDGIACTKSWVHAERGAAPLLALFDSREGALLGAIEAFALGQMRTGGIVGLATRQMAARGADELAIVGAGRQAMAQVAAVLAVRPLRRVRVFSRSFTKAQTFAERVRRELGIDAVGYDSVSAAVANAPIVTLVTRAREKFLSPSMVAPGAHVNAVGAITPERIEFAPELLGRCDPVVADNVEDARALSAELRAYFGEDALAWKRLVPLCSLVDSGWQRPPGADVTLFKTMGMGISDLTLAAEIYRRALARGADRRCPDYQRAAPRWRRDAPPSGEAQ